MIHTDGIQTIANAPARTPGLPEDPEVTTPRPDFIVTREGSLFLVDPCTPQAESWLKENVDQDAQYWGKRLVVEHGYIVDLVDGLADAEFTII